MFLGSVYTIMRVTAQTFSPGLTPSSSYLSAAQTAAGTGDSSDRKSPPPVHPSSSLTLQCEMTCLIECEIIYQFERAVVSIQLE